MDNDHRALVYSSSRKIHLRQFPTDNKKHPDNSNLLINRIEIPTVAPNTPDILTSVDIFLILLNEVIRIFLESTTEPYHVYFLQHLNQYNWKNHIVTTFYQHLITKNMINSDLCFLIMQYLECMRISKDWMYACKMLPLSITIKPNTIRSDNNIQILYSIAHNNLVCVTSLNLSGNGINSDACRVLADSILNLKTLNLRGNSLSTRECKCLFVSDRLLNLTELNLSLNDIDVSVKEIEQIVKEFKKANFGRSQRKSRADWTIKKVDSFGGIEFEK